MADKDSGQPPSCANCKKVQETSTAPLQRCSRCRSAFYCSKDCQKADWKNHKKHCGSNSDNKAGSTTSGFLSSKSRMESLMGLNTTTWLHDRPEAEVYKLLIDSYRMRVEDDCNFRGDIPEDSLYGGGNPVIGFRRFLKKAEKTNVLPSWWSKEKRDECIAKGDEKGPWSSLHSAVEKSDIQEHYKSSIAPMQLRMLAEEILGSNVLSG